MKRKDKKINVRQLPRSNRYSKHFAPSVCVMPATCEKCNAQQIWGWGRIPIGHVLDHLASCSVLFRPQQPASMRRSIAGRMVSQPNWLRQPERAVLLWACLLWTPEKWMTPEVVTVAALCWLVALRQHLNAFLFTPLLLPIGLHEAKAS